MKLVELEWHALEYERVIGTIADMIAARQFPSLFDACLASFPHLVPTLTFRKRKGIEPNLPSLLGLETICRYAPLLFEHAAILAARDYLRSTRHLARHENGYLQEIEAAIKREEAARLVWNHVQSRQPTPQSNVADELGLPPGVTCEILDAWEHLGVMARWEERGCIHIKLRSSLDADTQGICPQCGAMHAGSKPAFFKANSCTRCGFKGHFHIRYVAN